MPQNGPASMQHARLMRLRLDQTTAAEQEEQEYLSEQLHELLIADPEDRRPRKK